jgi:hypothetical protein
MILDQDMNVSSVHHLTISKYYCRTTAVSYGLRSESGHQGRIEPTARIGAVTKDMVNCFYSATLRGLTVIARATSQELSSDGDLIGAVTCKSVQE